MLLLAGNKEDLHTYAGRNCLGTEVMEGIYIARVGWRVVVVCRKEKKNVRSAQLKFIEGVALPSSHSQ